MKKILLFSYLALILITQIICTSNAVPECHYALMSAKDILAIIQNFKPYFTNITFTTQIIQNGNLQDEKTHVSIPPIQDPFSPQSNVAFYLKKAVLAVNEHYEEIGRITYVVTNVEQRAIISVTCNPQFEQTSLLISTLLCIALKDCAQFADVYTPPVIIIECLELFKKSDSASLQSILYHSCRYDPSYPVKPDYGWIDFKNREENLLKYPLYKNQPGLYREFKTQ